MKKITLAGLVLAALIPLASQAAVSPTQNWIRDDADIGYLRNNSNGVTLCATYNGFEESMVMEECHSNPSFQQLSYRSMIGVIEFRHMNDLALFAMRDSRVIVGENYPYASPSHFTVDNGPQIKEYGTNLCLDIRGGKNVKGAQLYMATCTK